MTVDSLSVAARILEEISCNAWPALRTLLYGGWVIRLSDGRTRRTNSVQPLYDSGVSLDERICHCVSIYHDSGLDALFKITPAVLPSDLDRKLASRGMLRVSETEVQTAGIERILDGRRSPEKAGRIPARDGTGAASHVDVRVTDEPSSDWFDRCFEWNEIPLRLRESTASMLSSSPVKRAYATAYLDGEPAGTAYAAVEGRWVGLFLVTVRADARRRGIGTALVRKIAESASADGAREAYLQVFSENDAARVLYRRLGFERQYTYWYRSVPVASDA